MERSAFALLTECRIDEEAQEVDRSEDIVFATKITFVNLAVSVLQVEIRTVSLDLAAVSLCLDVTLLSIIFIV